MATRFHPVPTAFHVTPPPRAIAAHVDEQPRAIGRGAFADSSQTITGEQLCRAGKNGKKNLLKPVRCTRPFLLVSGQRSSGRAAIPGIVPTLRSIQLNVQTTQDEHLRLTQRSTVGGHGRRLPWPEQPQLLEAC
jgi:hypothetical protein